MEEKIPYGLSIEQLSAWHRDGFLVIPDWWDSEQVDLLNTVSRRLLSEFNPPTDGVSVFSTEEQTNTADAYFLGSGDKVRYFFEPGALDTGGRLIKPKEIAINKIGHALHELVDEFRIITMECPRVKQVCRSLGFKNCLVPQSMLICKPPHIGGRVKPHVDGAFLYTEPQSVVGFWWPLETCTLTNGCLWAVPGSHLGGVQRRFKRTPGEDATEFDPPMEGAPFNLTGAVPLEIAAGSLVLLHSSVVHFSEANVSSVSRFAFSIHVVEGNFIWLKDNWLQRSTPFPVLY